MRFAEIRPGLCVGEGCPLLLIAGPCVIESAEHSLRTASAVQDICGRLGISFVFKSSFDKANRTSGDAFRGIAMQEALAALSKVRAELGVPVLTDIHESAQASMVAEVVDVLQIPAFLCRQTDLLLAAAATGRAINVKKGQFLAPWDMKYVAEKLRQGGAKNILLTERGTCFGYNTLVVDFRALPIMRQLGYPVVFDATHSVQVPGGQGKSTGGQREFVPSLARAAAAVGIDALFLEVHEDPDRAPSDGPNMVRLDTLEALLKSVLAIRAAAIISI